MPARFSPAYDAKIRREVTRYQKERSRLIRMGVYENVPERITYRQLVNQYYTKREMNKALKEMSLFTAGRAVKAVTIRGKVSTLYEVAKFRLLLGRERKAVSRELAAIEKLDSEYPLLHERYYKKLQARHAELNKPWQEIIGTRAGMQVLSKSVKSENLYTNWINALFQDAEKLGFPREKIEEIIRKFNKLTPQQFERMYNEDPAIGYIFSYYSAEIKGGGEIEQQRALDAFESIFQRLDATIERYKNIK